jgi:hypothetical protein
MEFKENMAKSISRATVLLIIATAVFAIMSIHATQARADIGTEKIVDPQTIIDLPWDNEEMKPVPPPFIMTAQNRWGCLACHSNKRLSRIRDGREESLFIDPNVIGSSMHKQIACINCHTNFSYVEHPATNPEDYRKVAGLACMKCHPYQKALYEQSIHGRLAAAGEKGELAGKETDPALCCDCHGSHNIQSPRFEPNRSKFRASAKETCGKCHTDRYASYGDYYHGQAYKNKADDAPVCWDCHDNHKIIKHESDGRKTFSPVGSPGNLNHTCGKCHDHPERDLITYAPMIHGRQAVLDNNFVFNLLSILVPRREEAAAPEPAKGIEPLGATKITKQEENKSLFSALIDVFFPPSLRPLGN